MKRESGENPEQSRCCMQSLSRAEHDATEAKSIEFQVSSFRFQVSSFKFQVSGFKFQVTLLPCYFVTLLLCYFEKLPREGVHARTASQKTCRCRATARSYTLERREGEKQLLFDNDL